LVLLRQFNESSEQWTDYIPDLVDAGFVVFALDLPFHGLSGQISGQSKHLLLTDPTLGPPATQAALSWLVSQPQVLAERIGIVGTSVGANLACVLQGSQSEAGTAVKLAVAISPRDTAVMSLAEPVRSLAFSGLFCAAGALDNDGVQADTCASFGRLSAPPVEVVVIEDTDAHGSVLLEDHPGIWAQILSFLTEHL